MCIHLAEGKCIALEVKCTDTSLNCVCEFRKICGPRDPVIHFYALSNTRYIKQT